MISGVYLGLSFSHTCGLVLLSPSHLLLDPVRHDVRAHTTNLEYFNGTHSLIFSVIFTILKADLRLKSIIWWSTHPKVEQNEGEGLDLVGVEYGPGSWATEKKEKRGRCGRLRKGMAE